MTTLHHFQVDVTVQAPSRAEAQGIFLASVKSKLRSESMGVVALAILDGIVGDH